MTQCVGYLGHLAQGKSVVSPANVTAVPFLFSVSGHWPVSISLEDRGVSNNLLILSIS